MFGLEVILGNFSFSRFSPIMISSVVATAISRHYLGVGYETMDRALFSELEWKLLVILVFMKIAATSFTLGSGASGGVIAPSPFVGCMLGGAFGALVNLLFPTMSGAQGAYALVAMGALVSTTTTRTPLTSILMIFEMTGDYALILPLMICIIISTALSAYLLKPSVYTLRLLRRNVDHDKGQETNILRSLTVAEIRVPLFETIPPQTPLDDLMTRLADSSYTEFYITDAEGRYKGTVTFDRIRSLVAYGQDLEGVIVAHDIAQYDLPTVRDRDTLDRVMLLFGQHHVNAFPVVDPGDGTPRRRHQPQTRHRRV